MQRIWPLWVEFWKTDKSLSVLLGMLIIVALVLPPLAVADLRRNMLSDGLFSLLLCAGVAAVWSESRWVFWIVATVAIGSFVIRWLIRLAPAGEFTSWNAALDVFALVCF